MNDPAESRVQDLLELLVVQHREACDAHARDWAQHVRALEAQHACTRRAIRWFGAFILAFGAIAGFAVARPSLAWLLSG